MGVKSGKRTGRPDQVWDIIHSSTRISIRTHVRPASWEPEGGGGEMVSLVPESTEGFRLFLTRSLLFVSWCGGKACSTRPAAGSPSGSLAQPQLSSKQLTDKKKRNEERDPLLVVPKEVPVLVFLTCSTDERHRREEGKKEKKKKKEKRSTMLATWILLSLTASCALAQKVTAAKSFTGWDWCVVS